MTSHTDRKQNKLFNIHCANSKMCLCTNSAYIDYSKPLSVGYYYEILGESDDGLRFKVIGNTGDIGYYSKTHFIK